MSEAMPWSKEGEIIVLATAMVDGPSFMPKALEAGLAIEDFYDPLHRVIWGAILELATAGDPTEEVAVIERLRNMPAEKPNWDNRLSELGGISVVIEITNQIEATGTAPYYLRIVKQKSLQRKAIRAAGELLKAAKTPARDFEEVSARLGPMLSELAELSATEHEETTLEVVQALREMAKKDLAGESTVKDENALVYWPIKVLNERLSPLDPNNMDFLITICGESSHGKSAFVGQMAAWNILNLKRKGLLFLLETTRRRVMAQMCGQRSGVNLRESLRGQYGDRDEVKPWGLGKDRVERYFGEIDAVEEAVREKRLFMREQTYDLSAMKQTARLVDRECGGLNFIIVDYLQEMHREEEDERLRSDEILGRHARELKRLGKQLNLPVIVISSLNRGTVDKNEGPMIKSLRGSGDIEYASDRIGAIHRPFEDMNGNEQHEGRAVFQVFFNQLKDRAGLRGKVWLQFRPTTTTFFGPPPAGKRGRPKKETHEQEEVF